MLSLMGEDYNLIYSINLNYFRVDCKFLTSFSNHWRALKARGYVLRELNNVLIQVKIPST